MGGGPGCHVTKLPAGVFPLPVMILQSLSQSLQFGDINLTDLPADKPADPDLAPVLVLTHDLPRPGGRPVDGAPHDVGQGELFLLCPGTCAVPAPLLLLLLLLT